MQKTQSNNYLIVLVKGSIISFFGAGCIGILNYFVRRELALSLNIVDFGFIYSAYALCNLFLAYLDMGLGQSATILISKAFSNNLKSLGNQYYLQVLLIKLLLSIVVFIFMSLTYKFWLKDFFKYSNATPYFILLLVIIFQAVATAPSSVVTALKKFSLLYSGQILIPISMLIIIVFFNPLHNISIYALSFSIGAIIMFLFWFFILWIKGYSPKTKSIKEFAKIGEIFNLSKWIAISTLGLTTMFYMDSLMLTWLDGLKAVGLYNVALPIMQIAGILLVVPTVFLPIVSEMWSDSKEQEIAVICKFMTEVTAYLFWPVAFTIILLAKLLIIVLFSSQFTAAATALMILFTGNILFSLSNFYMGTLNAGKYAKLVAISIIIAALVNILLNYLLIPYFSLTGAATATATSYLFITIYLYILLKKKIKGFSVNKNKIIKFSILGSICVLIAFSFNFKLHFDLYYILGLVVIINLIYFSVTFKTIFSYYNIAMSLLKK